jgi:hypothetical protein
MNQAKHKKGFFMTLIARTNNRGIFLNKIEIALPGPEIIFYIEFATRLQQIDPQTNVETVTLVDSKMITASSIDKGKTFRIGQHVDLDGDGDIDRHDRAKLIALVKAYNAIVNP